MSFAMFVCPDNLRQEHSIWLYELYHIHRPCHNFQTIFYKPFREKNVAIKYVAKALCCL